MNKILGIGAIILIFGIVIWFGLGIYATSYLPGIYIDNGAFLIKNCETPRDKNAISVCPNLYCNKALLESGEILLDAQISVTGEYKSPQEKRHMIGGIINDYSLGLDESAMHFQCWMRGDKVLKYEFAKAKEWVRKLQSDKWKI